jgi:Ferritin-like
MKSIAEFVQSGIADLRELRDALQTAMRLEFATIPPYLCAQWSINDDPSNVAGMIQNIVIEEMLHFALAGNMLNAIGRTPSIADPAFIPTYPTHTLPGGISLRHAVDLKPLSHTQLEVFQEIEKPEFPPVALALARRPATIGAFYDTIAAGFEKVKPAIDPEANFVTITEMAPPFGPISDPKGGQILTLADAQAAIARIKQEGEGTRGDPEQPPDDVANEQEFAHYYVFKEIFEGKKLQRQPNGHWAFDGAEITFPTVYQFAKSTAAPDPSAAFSRELAALLTELQTCWTAGAQPNFADMDQLQAAGVALIKQAIQPEFIWPGTGAG